MIRNENRQTTAILFRSHETRTLAKFGYVKVLTAKQV